MNSARKKGEYLSDLHSAASDLQIGIYYRVEGGALQCTNVLLYEQDVNRKKDCRC